MNQISNILQSVRPDIDFSVEKGLLKEGVLDSLDVVLIVTKLSESFGILIDAEDINYENFDSIERIQQLINNKLIQQ